jgi:NAD-dependent deacetylase
MCDLAARAGAELIIVNRDPTPYDRSARRVIRDDITAALPALVDELVPVAS